MLSSGSLNRRCHKAFSVIEYVLGDEEKNAESSEGLVEAEKELWCVRFNEWNKEPPHKKSKIHHNTEGHFAFNIDVFESLLFFSNPYIWCCD